MGLFPEARKDSNWFYRHSLSLVLAILLFLQTAYAVWAGHRVWVDELLAHGHEVHDWSTDFWIWWSFHYNVALVADTFGVILIVLLTKYLYEQGSTSSK